MSSTFTAATLFMHEEPVVDLLGLPVERGHDRVVGVDEVGLAVPVLLSQLTDAHRASLTLGSRRRR